MTRPAPDPERTEPRVFRGKVVRYGKRPSEHRSAAVRWSRRFRNARRAVIGWVVTAVVAVLMRLPNPLLVALSHGIAPIAKWRLKAIADRNLERVFGDSKSTAERLEIRNTVFRRLRRLLVDWIRFTREGQRFVDRFVDGEQARAELEQLERTWGGGYILVTAHFGNWELAGQWTSLQVERPWGGCVAKRQPNPRLNRVIEGLRGRHGMTTLYRDDPPTRIVRLLRAGRGIGMVTDQTTENVGGVFLDFLGHPAYTPVGPARLAVTCNVPILTASMRQTEDGYAMRIDHILWPDPKAARDQEIVRMTAAWSRVFEQWILEEPDQWQWGHDRWRLTPEVLERKNRVELSLAATEMAATGHRDSLDQSSKLANGSN